MSRGVLFAFLLFFLCFCLPLHAAYRLYKLKVSHYDNRGRVVRVDEVVSVLDANQYENYTAGYGHDKVEILDTWYCPGDTSHHPYCPKPIVQDRTPANAPGDRGGLPYGRQPIIP